MAQVEDTSAISQLKMEAKLKIKDSDLRVHDFAFRGRKARELDFSEQLNAMAATSRDAQAAQSSALGLKSFDLDFSAVAGGLIEQGPEAPFIREAKKLMAESKHREALAPLAKVLEISANHPEGLYLQSLCYFHLKDYAAALHSLEPLEHANLRSRMNTRVETHRTDIRREMLRRVMKSNERYLAENNYDAAIALLRQAQEADPPVGKYPCLLAATLMVVKQEGQALKVIREAQQHCETEREEIDAAAVQIERKYLGRLLAGAKASFRQAKYVEARKNLAALPPEIQRAKLWITFDGFLERLGAGATGLRAAFGVKKSVGSATPPGEPRDVEALYEFLVHEEMKEATAQIDAKNYTAAQRALERAISYTPGYSLANHYCATCIYKRIGAEAKQLQEIKEVEPLDRYMADLKVAAKLAKVACQDRELEDAPELLKSIEQMSEQMQTLKTKLQYQKIDSEMIKESVIRLLTLFLQAKLITSAPQFFTFWGEFQSFKNDLHGSKYAAKTDEGRQLIGMIRDFVDRNVAAVEGMIRNARGY